jgi:hypothetical protein
MLSNRDYNLVQALVTATAELARTNVMLDITTNEDVIDALVNDVLLGDALISNIWSELNIGESNETS